MIVEIPRASAHDRWCRLSASPAPGETAPVTWEWSVASPGGEQKPTDPPVSRPSTNAPAT
ncbi:hypothetical protein [Herbidospora yilanensis]|uniref:hypothetical protein n=1 Tax=Herbidospora yilanensis TaxID=354426 RepID=UPI0007825ACA|nr:hypothetical protein [Herbidospora yilanensis]